LQYWLEDSFKLTLDPIEPLVDNCQSLVHALFQLIHSLVETSI